MLPGGVALWQPLIAHMWANLQLGVLQDPLWYLRQMGFTLELLDPILRERGCSFSVFLKGLSSVRISSMEARLRASGACSYLCLYP